MFPTGAGDDLCIDRTGCRGIDHGLHFGACAQGRLIQIIDITTQELRHGLVGIFYDHNDDVLHTGAIGVIGVRLQRDALPFDPFGDHKGAKAQRCFGNFGQGGPLSGRHIF